MSDLRPSGELIQDREQIRYHLLTAFDDAIKGTSHSNNDEMTARFLLDVVTYVLSFNFPNNALNDRDQIKTFTRSETLRFEMYLREHLLRRRTASDDLSAAEQGSIPTQPSEGD